jgi:ribonucleoside-diphosphate reductase alpha chain
MAWTYMIDHPHGKFALFVGHIEQEGRELAVRSLGQRPGPAARPRRRRQDAVDGHARQRPRLARSSSSNRWPRRRTAKASTCPSRRTASRSDAGRGFRDGPADPATASNSSARFKNEGPTPVLDALFSLKEPKTGTDGTLSWTVDIFNPATGEDFVLGLKEITLPDGVTRPYSMWLSGNYPRALDGLTKLLSLDMRVLDPAWIGMKLGSCSTTRSRSATSWPSCPAHASSRTTRRPWPTSPT